MQMSNYLFFKHDGEQALGFYARSGLGCATQVMHYGTEG